MRDRAVRTLIALEWRRARMLFGRAFGPLAVAAVLFLLLFGSGPDGWGMVLAVAGMSYGMVPGLRALPEKVDGTLEFLTSLPVSPGQLATAHLASCAAYAALAAAAWTGTAALTGPAYFQRDLPPGWLLGVFVGLWLSATLVSTLGSAAIIRFPLERVSWLPAVLFLGLMAVTAGAERLWPDGDRRLLAWLLLPRSPTLLFAWLMAAELLGLAGGYRLLRSGFAAFRPGEGLMDGALP